MNKVVLAYSGGLDTSIIIPWLNENYGLDVIAMVADVGQGEDIDAVVEKAYKTGAKEGGRPRSPQRIYSGVRVSHRQGGCDLRRQISTRHLDRPTCDRQAPGGSRARRRCATSVAHGCTGKGNDQVRFEHAYQALAPELKVIAPWREWTLKSREDCLDYAEAHGIPVAASREKIHSRDRNLWHVSHEGGELEDANNAPFDSTWTMTRSPKDAPDMEEVVDIGFVQRRTRFSRRHAPRAGPAGRTPQRNRRPQRHRSH